MLKRVIGYLVVQTAFVFIATLLMNLTPQSARAAKVNVNPSTKTLTEGQSQVMTVTLDEPILAASGVPQVSLHISDPSGRLSFSPANLIIPAGEWAMSHTFSITAIDNALDDGDATPALLITNDSNSEYYAGFIPSFTVNVVDNDDPAPVLSSSPIATPATLPRVGGGAPVHALLFLMGIGVIAILVRTVVGK